MSLKYNDNNGVLHNVSGLNGLSGELVVGTTTTRSGTISVPALHNTSADPWKSLSVTFADPMPDTDYEVTFTLAGGYWNNVIINVGVKYKTGFEFDISVTSLGDVPNDTVLRINWKAFKLYTAEDITKAQSDIIGLQNKVTLEPSQSFVAPFIVIKNSFCVNVSTADGNAISNKPLTANTWSQNVRNIGTISTKKPCDYIMAPVLFQSDVWANGVARIYYSGRVDLWSSVTMTSYIPYVNATLPIFD